MLMGLGLGVCCCSQSCTIASDDFERNEIGDNWNIVSGEWEIGYIDPLIQYLGHTLQLNSDGTEGKIEYTAEDISSLTDLYVSFVLKFTGTNDTATNEWWTEFPTGIKWRLHLWGDLYIQWEITQIYVSTGYDYCYWKVKLMDGTTEIGKDEFQTTGSISQFNQHTINVCVYEEDGVTAVTTLFGHTPGRNIYLGEITIQEGEDQYLALSADLPDEKWIWFDDFTVKHSNTTINEIQCPTCHKRCSVCKYDRMPNYLKVTVSGLNAGNWPMNADQTTGCRWCDCFQEEIYLGYNALSWLDNGAVPSCVYRGYINSWCHPSQYLWAFFWFDDEDSHYKVTLNLANKYYWRLDLGTEKPDCSTVDGEMTFHFTSLEQHFCDWPNATVSIEAVEEAPPAPQYCPPCDDCGLDFPETITVELSGMTDGTCADCSDFNGTYVFDFYNWVWGTSVGEGGTCTYRYTFPVETTGICAYPYMEVRLSVHPERNHVDATFEIAGGGLYHYYETGIFATWSNLSYPITRPFSLDLDDADNGGHLYGQYDLRGIQRNYCQIQYVNNRWVTLGHVTITMT